MQIENYLKIYTNQLLKKSKKEKFMPGFKIIFDI